MTERLSNLNFSGGAKATGLPVATAAGEAVVFEQLNAAIEGLAWKDNVVAASVANINLAAPGTTIDGVTMASNNRFLAKDQTSATENGVYIWNGSAVAATRAADMSASTEFTSAVVPVNPGGTVNAKTNWRQTAVDPTVGSTSIAFESFGTTAPSASESTPGIAELATQTETDTGTDDARIVTPLKLASYSGRAKRYAATLGDGSATSIVITHNLGTRSVNVKVYKNSGTYEEVECDIQHTSTNTITLIFASAPASAALAVVVTA